MDEKASVLLVNLQAVHNLCPQGENPFTCSHVLEVDSSVTYKLGDRLLPKVLARLDTNWTPFSKMLRRLS